MTLSQRRVVIIVPAIGARLLEALFWQRMNEVCNFERLIALFACQGACDHVCNDQFDIVKQSDENERTIKISPLTMNER